MNTPIKKVKLGLIGLGNMGGSHANYLKMMQQVELVGVCDIVKEKADTFAAECNCPAYYSHIDLFEKSGLEAVLIAVPHYDHTPISIDAFNRGLHVLCEKPLAVHEKDSQKILEAYKLACEKNQGIVFGLMLMQRTLPQYIKLKDILTSGELGKLVRVTWINTAWFRSQAYYNSSSWRATWAGEGGGILTNQCPHDLDMYQWLFGVPSKINGQAHIGKYHDIEVEDEVTAYFEHHNGMIGHFIVSTGESPGTSRLEIVGEYGKIIYENGKLIFYRNRKSMFEFSKETKECFASIENWYTEIPVSTDCNNAHRKVSENFIQEIMDGKGQLIAPGTEGIKSVTMANAIMLSSFKEKTINLPFDADEYENKLKELIKSSKFVKSVSTDVKTDMLSSYSKS